MMKRSTLPLAALFPILQLALGATSSCTLLSSSNTTGSTCGARVQIAPDLFPAHADGSPQFVDSLASCAELCGRRRASNVYQVSYYEILCTGFTYHPSDGFCQLIGVPFSSTDIRDDQTSDTELYDLDCFDCGAACPQPIGQNLLDNGDFQGELLGPWSSEGGSVVLGKNASQVFRCNSRTVSQLGNFGAKCQLQQGFNQCPGVIYSLSFDYKLPTEGSVSRSVFVNFENGFFVNPFSHFTTIKASGMDRTWRSFQGFFQPDPASYNTFTASPISITFEEPENATATKAFWYLDNVRVVRIPKKLVAKAGATSAVTNGGFENGKAAPWTVVSGINAPSVFKIVSPGLGGSAHALQVFVNETSSSFEINIPVIYQTITTTPGEQYLVTFDFVTAAPTYFLTFSTATAPGSVPESFTTAEVTLSNNDSNNYSASLPFVAYNKATNLTISVLVNMNLGSFTIDNISVKQISKRII